MVLAPVMNAACVPFISKPSPQSRERKVARERPWHCEVAGRALAYSDEYVKTQASFVLSLLVPGTTLHFPKGHWSPKKVGKEVELHPKI